MKAKRTKSGKISVEMSRYDIVDLQSFLTTILGNTETWRTSTSMLMEKDYPIRIELALLTQVYERLLRMDMITGKDYKLNLPLSESLALCKLLLTTPLAEPSLLQLSLLLHQKLA